MINNKIVPLVPKTDEIVAFLSSTNLKILEDFRNKYPKHLDIFKEGETAGVNEFAVERLMIKCKLCIAAMQEAIKIFETKRPRIVASINFSNKLVLISQIITIITGTTLLGLVIANERTSAIIVSLLSLASSVIAAIVDHNNNSQFLAVKKSVFTHYDELMRYKLESEYILNELKFYTETHILENEIEMVTRLVNKGNKLSFMIKEHLERSLK